jgi:hypothetical protein
VALMYPAQRSVSQPPADPKTKIKSKDGEVRVRDKSKPVRAALEAQYATMRQAYFDDDPEPVLELQAPDFTAQLPDGGRWSPEDATSYLRASFDQVERTIRLSFDIDSLTVQGDTAIANIHQQWERMQNKAGALRHVETEAHQREWWRLTPAGWRRFFVDNVRRGVWRIDGKRIDPSKPYDPDAPPFEP